MADCEDNTEYIIKNWRITNMPPTKRDKGPITTDYIYSDTQLPPYLPFPRFLLQTDLPLTAKLVYMQLLDRTTLSQKNDWQDENGRVYIVYPIENIAKTTRKSATTEKTALSDLEKAGLIVRRKTDIYKPNRIYVKLPPEGQNTVPLAGENPSSIETENYPTDGQKTGSMVERKLSPNNLNNNNLNQNNMSRARPAPTAYGRYKNVFLTDAEYAELLSDFPDRLDKLISDLSSYMKSTGKSYQNHAATIRRWAENDRAKWMPKQRGIPNYTRKDGESL